jgi:shikimate dehydrogenase
VLHRAAYRALGLDEWTYEAFDVAGDQLAAFLARERGWSGFSLTMPLKAIALDLATHVDPLARLTGGANTLTPTPDGSLAATNTDVDGIAAALREAGATATAMDLAPAGGLAPAATVLGSGATAASAVAALASGGIAPIEVWARHPERAAHLPTVAQSCGATATVRGVTPGQAAPQTPIVIATLPPGAADPYADVGVADAGGRVLLDVAYDPWPSRLARAWARAGGTVIPGLVMLLHQAARQVEAMTGLPAPIGAMRTALEGVRPGGTDIVRGHGEWPPWVN